MDLLSGWIRRPRVIISTLMILGGVYESAHWTGL
ncbi:hypothetical protein NGRRMQZB_89 [Escherichia phage Dru_SM1]